MEGTVRRKSNSSESEISEGWNLVDAAGVVHGEASDAESIEVIQDELTDNHSTDSEQMEDLAKCYQGSEEKNETSGSGVVVVGTKPEKKHFSFKELCEAGTVFIILATLAMTLSYGLLAIEETITSAKPLLWDVIMSSMPSKEEGTNNELVKVIADLDFYKEENRRLIEKVRTQDMVIKENLLRLDYENGKEGPWSLATTERSRKLEELWQQSTEMEISVSAEVDTTGSAEVDIGGSAEVELKSSGSPELGGKAKEVTNIGTEKSLEGQRETRHGDKEKGAASGGETVDAESLKKTLDRLRLIAATLAPVDSAPALGPFDLLVDALDTIPLISDNPQLKQFTEKWTPKLNNFIHRLGSDTDRIIDKLNSHIVKSVTGIQKNFVSRFCSVGVDTFSLNVNEKQNAFCEKYKHLVDKKNGNGKQKPREGERKMEKPLKNDKSQGSKYKKCDPQISSKEGNPSSSEGFEGGFCDGRKSKYNHDKAVNKNAEFKKTQTETPPQQVFSDKKAGGKHSSKENDRAANIHVDNSYVNTGAERYPDKKPEDKGSTKDYKSHHTNGKDVNKYKDQENENTKKERQSAYKGSSDSSKEKEGKRYKNRSGDNSGERKEKQGRYEVDGASSKERKDGKKNWSDDMKRTRYEGSSPGKNANDPEKRTRCSSCEDRSGEYKKRRKEEGKVGSGRHNSSVSGRDWFTELGKWRAGARARATRSEWLFERARGRLRARPDKSSRWVFDRAWLRQRCRDDPQYPSCLALLHLYTGTFNS